jgi:2-methylisocitrate lyase-like PEP mutase family enzyme
LSQITHKDLNKLTRDQLVALCLKLADTANPLIDSMEGYRQQLKNAATLMKETNLFDATATSDKDDKIFDRGKVVMEKIFEWQSNLKKMEAMIMPNIQKDALIIEEAREGDITQYNDSGK